eukprot:snap_masked-scaffold_3-processed-gene-10.9-mRNA-1 protein AED:1.00 eAED:1.00 QI:0/-1/0/0/-1/1/1/0/333
MNTEFLRHKTELPNFKVSLNETRLEVTYTINHVERKKSAEFFNNYSEKNLSYTLLDLNTNNLSDMDLRFLYKIFYKSNLMVFVFVLRKTPFQNLSRLLDATCGAVSHVYHLSFPWSFHVEDIIKYLKRKKIECNAISLTDSYKELFLKGLPSYLLLHGSDCKKLEINVPRGFYLLKYSSYIKILPKLNSLSIRLQVCTSNYAVSILSYLRDSSFLSVLSYLHIRVHREVVIPSSYFALCSFQETSELKHFEFATDRQKSCVVRLFLSCIVKNRKKVRDGIYLGWTRGVYKLYRFEQILRPLGYNIYIAIEFALMLNSFYYNMVLVFSLIKKNL